MDHTIFDILFFLKVNNSVSILSFDLKFIHCFFKGFELRSELSNLKILVTAGPGQYLRCCLIALHRNVALTKSSLLHTRGKTQQ